MYEAHVLGTVLSVPFHTSLPCTNGKASGSPFIFPALLNDYQQLLALPP